MASDPHLVVRPYLLAKSEAHYRSHAFHATRRIDSFPLVIFIAVAIVLSSRQMYIALDDLNNIDAFLGYSYWFGDFSKTEQNWWRFIIEEPIWNIYCAWSGEEIGAENAFRLTIFVSVLLYLFFASKLSNGHWGTTLLLFIAHPNFAVQMYYNQIRQGVALSIFLMLYSVLKISSWKRVGVASGLSALVHTSFVAVFPLALSYILPPRLRLAIALVCSCILFAVTQYIDLASLVDVGRRAETLSDSSVLNIRFYMLTIGTYATIFYVLYPGANKLSESEWYIMSFLVATIATGMGSLSETASRLHYLPDAFINILIASNIRTQKGVIAFCVLMLSIAIRIVSTLQSDISTQINVFDKWRLILSGLN